MGRHFCSCTGLVLTAMSGRACCLRSRKAGKDAGLFQICAAMGGLRIERRTVLRGYAADVAGLFDQDEEIVVAGHSMGGLVALALATHWFGIRVRRAVAFGVKIEWTPSEVAEFHQLSEAPVRWFDSEAEAIGRYLKVSGLTGLVTADTPEARSGVCVRDGRHRLAVDPKTYRVVGPDVASFIASASAPFRLAAGSKDPMVELSHMVPYDPKAHLFEGLGHNAHVEDPTQVWAFISGA